jgi:hypothetical protein
MVIPYARVLEELQTLLQHALTCRFSTTTLDARTRALARQFPTSLPGICLRASSRLTRNFPPALNKWARLVCPVPSLLLLVPCLSAFLIRQPHHFMSSLAISNHLAKDILATLLNADLPNSSSFSRPLTRPSNGSCPASFPLPTPRSLDARPFSLPPRHSLRLSQVAILNAAFLHLLQKANDSDERILCEQQLTPIVIP